MVPRGLRTYANRYIEVEVMADEKFAFLDGLHIAQRRVNEEHGGHLKFHKCVHVHECAKSYLFLLEERGVSWHPEGG